MSDDQDVRVARLMQVVFGCRWGHELTADDDPIPCPRRHSGRWPIPDQLFIDIGDDPVASLLDEIEQDGQAYVAMATLCEQHLARAKDPSKPTPRLR